MTVATFFFAFRQAIERMVEEYGDEFEFLVQPRVEGALPMYYVHTDLALLAQADYLIMTASPKPLRASF